MRKEFAIVARDGKYFGSWACGPGQLFVELRHVLHLAIFRQPRVTSIPHDLQQPGAHVSPRKPWKNRYERSIAFLRDVFGIRAAAQKPAGWIEGGIEMWQDKRLEAHLPRRVQHV